MLLSQGAQFRRGKTQLMGRWFNNMTQQTGLRFHIRVVINFLSLLFTWILCMFWFSWHHRGTDIQSDQIWLCPCICVPCSLFVNNYRTPRATKYSEPLRCCITKKTIVTELTHCAVGAPVGAGHTMFLLLRGWNRVLQLVGQNKFRLHSSPGH